MQSAYAGGSDADRASSLMKWLVAVVVAGVFIGFAWVEVGRLHTSQNGPVEEQIQPGINGAGPPAPGDDVRYYLHFNCGDASNTQCGATFGSFRGIYVGAARTLTKDGCESFRQTLGAYAAATWCSSDSDPQEVR